MKIRALGGIAAAVVMTLSAAPVMAETYTYMETIVDVSLDDADVNVKVCPSEKMQEEMDGEVKCSEQSAKVAALVSTLNERIETYAALLEDKEATSEKLKAVSAEDDLIEIDNQRDGEVFVLIPLAPGMSMPILKSDLEKEDYSTAFTALEANIERYTAIVSMLESGNLPEEANYESIVEARKINDLVNVVQMQQSL